MKVLIELIEFIFSSVVADDPANAGNQTIDDYFSVMSDLNLSSSEKMNLAVWLLAVKMKVKKEVTMLH